MTFLTNGKTLEETVATSLRRQHFLGAVPPAQRVLPAALFVVGDYLARKDQGHNVVEQHLCGADPVHIRLPAVTLPPTRCYPGFGTIVAGSCLTCSPVSHRTVPWKNLSHKVSVNYVEPCLEVEHRIRLRCLSALSPWTISASSKGSGRFYACQAHLGRLTTGTLHKAIPL